MKQNLLISSILLSTGPLAFAASGIFGTGTVLDNNGTLTFYQTTLLGDGRHAPSGASPSQNSAGLGGADLGIFNPGNGDSLTFKGGGVLTFKNGSDNITGATVFFSINGGVESSVGLVFNEDNVNGTGGDQRWYSDGSTIDLLAGLGNGTHSLAVRYESPFTWAGGSGTYNEGSFTATFTTIPEPSAALLGGLGVICLLRRRRS